MERVCSVQILEPGLTQVWPTLEPELFHGINGRVESSGWPVEWELDAPPPREGM